MSGSQRTVIPIEQNGGEPACRPPVPLKGQIDWGAGDPTGGRPPSPLSPCPSTDLDVVAADFDAWLAPIPGLVRRDPEHRYWLGAHLFPVSITGVLAAGKSSYALQRISSTQAIWGPRGTSCHLALELALKARRPAASGPARPAPHAASSEESFHDYREWIAPLLHHPRWDQVLVIAAERPTCCLIRNVAGTYDTAYLDPALPIPEGRPEGITGPARVLADLKTLSGSGRTYCTRAQIGGYMALEWSQGQWFDYGQTIWCQPGCTFFSAPTTRGDCLSAWAAAWTLYAARVRPF